MIKLLGIIPAKKNSSSIKNKNFLKIGKKRIIDQSIEVLKKSKYINYKFVDTDSIEIANYSKKLGINIPFLRPKKLALKNSPVYKTILNSILKLEKFYKTKFDAIILLQPTSPLRTTRHVNKAIESFIKLKSTTMVSICPIEEPHPFKIFKINNNKITCLIKHKRKNLNRQFLPKFFKLNGAIYIVKRDYFIKKKKFVSENSNYYLMENKDSINLDTKNDLILYKNFLKKIE